MAGIGKAIKGLGLLGKKKKTGWGANLKERSRVFKEGQAKHKALDIKEGKKKHIKKDPHEGVPSQSSDWPYWRGEE